MTNKCNWTDHSGTSQEYFVHEWATSWNAVSGNYIAAKLTPDGWVAYYIGRTNSFEERLRDGHDGLRCARIKGATHIHARAIASEAIRMDEERRLIETYKPSCNTQHR